MEFNKLDMKFVLLFDKRPLFECNTANSVNTVTIGANNNRERDKVVSVKPWESVN